MLTVIYKQTRTNKDFEWWHFLPDVKSWLDPFEKKMIDAGIMISCANTVSDDELTFIRVAKFESKEQLNLLYTKIPKFNYQQDRTQYAEEHLHSEISEQRES